MMQANVGIVRLQNEMEFALDGIGKLKQRAAKVAVQGHLEYNPGWHTAIDLKHLLTISEAITICSIDRRESRGGHFREDFPNKDPEAQKYNSVISKATDGSMKLRREPIPAMREDLKQVIEEMK
jgi:succinate dehydrogenase / fumarate reductase flavoprotein subunit